MFKVRVKGQGGGGGDKTCDKFKLWIKVKFKRAYSKETVKNKG